ncbi:MAG: SAM-dependent methyltransferase, partial [Pirellulaceae bacterium]
PEAKGQLSKTIRALRSRLLEDFKSANDSTFKYSIRRIDQAKLSEAIATRRRRIEEWIAEQVRGEAGKKTKRTAEDFRRDLEKQAAYTLLNRMLILRLMEAMKLNRGDLVSKGWNSEAYKSFRFFSQEIVRGEESEGYSVLLQMVFDDLA